MLGLTVEVKVKTVDGEVLKELDGFADTTIGSGDGDLGRDRCEGLVDLLVLGTEGLGLVHDKDGLIDLDVLDAGSLELGKELDVDGEESVKGLDRLV